MRRPDAKTADAKVSPDSPTRDFPSSLNDSVVLRSIKPPLASLSGAFEREGDIMTGPLPSMRPRRPIFRGCAYCAQPRAKLGILRRDTRTRDAGRRDCSACKRIRRSARVRLVRQDRGASRSHPRDRQILERREARNEDTKSTCYGSVKVGLRAAAALI